MALGRLSSLLALDALIHDRQEWRRAQNDLVREEEVEDLEEVACVSRRTLGPAHHL